jgi:ketosteroid isomerase-like protein
MLALIAVSFPTLANGQASPASGDSAAIVKLEDGWAKALLKRDKAYFASNLGRGFVYTEDGVTSTREEVLGSIVTPQDTVTAARNEQMTVHLFGPSTAVVTGLLAIDGHLRGVGYAHRYKFTDTWVKQPNGRWKIVAAQDYLIKP